MLPSSAKAGHMYCHSELLCSSI